MSIQTEEKLRLKLEYLRELKALVEIEKFSSSTRESYATKIMKLSDSIDRDLGI